ncbi:hypothetical protein BC835DRAFT_1004502 [Cytidiella melzeri]|nr:hypothetical protein BC835DRAFT_1004502 [Cytidiella melzeri]
MLLPTGLNIPAVMFGPPNGRDYKLEDFERSMSQQPLPASNFPRILLPDARTKYIPPILRLGWIIDYFKLFDILNEHFPSLVVIISSKKLPMTRTARATRMRLRRTEMRRVKSGSDPAICEHSPVASFTTPSVASSVCMSRMTSFYSSSPCLIHSVISL